MTPETRFKISVPRFQRSPVDTFLFSQMMNMVVKDLPIAKDLVTEIRFIVKEETGHDPFIFDNSRKQEYVKARQLFTYFCRKYTKMTFNEIGGFIGKDHATAIYADKCVNNYRRIEKLYRAIFLRINNRIRESIKYNGLNN